MIVLTAQNACRVGSVVSMLPEYLDGRRILDTLTMSFVFSLLPKQVTEWFSSKQCGPKSKTGPKMGDIPWLTEELAKTNKNFPTEGARHITLKPQTYEYIKEFRKMKIALNIGHHKYLFSKFNPRNPDYYEYHMARKYFERTAIRFRKVKYISKCLYL